MYEIRSVALFALASGVAVSGCSSNNNAGEVSDNTIAIDDRGVPSSIGLTDPLVTRVLKEGRDASALTHMVSARHRDAMVVYSWVSMQNRSSNCKDVMNLMESLSGDAAALYLRGCMYVRAYGVERDYGIAFKLFSDSSRKGCSTAAIDMARCAYFLRETYNDKRVDLTMFKLVEGMSDAGYVRATGLLGLFKLEGYGCEKSSHVGRLLISQAAAARDADSLYKLAIICAQEGQSAKSEGLLTDAISAGSVSAITMLSEFKRRAGDEAAAHCLRLRAIRSFDSPALVIEAASVGDLGDHFSACVYYELAARMGVPIGKEYCKQLYAQGCVAQGEVLSLVTRVIESGCMEVEPKNWPKQPNGPQKMDGPISSKNPLQP